jgi:hypothetical protein
MNLKRLLNTKLGVFLISVILGIGLATLFHKVCDGKKCINFNGPLISEIDGKIYKYGEECYKYSFQSAPCDPLKKTVELGSPKKDENNA